MMTDEQKSKVAELRSVIAAATRADGAPREARVAAVYLKRELRRTGTTARVLARRAGGSREHVVPVGARGRGRYRGDGRREGGGAGEAAG